MVPADDRVMPNRQTHVVANSVRIRVIICMKIYKDVIYMRHISRNQNYITNSGYSSTWQYCAVLLENIYRYIGYTKTVWSEEQHASTDSFMHNHNVRVRPIFTLYGQCIHILHILYYDNYTPSHIYNIRCLDGKIYLNPYSIITSLLDKDC